MNELMIFEGKQVEVFEVEGKVLFNPYHVAECLDIKNVRDNLARMNDNQVVKLTNSGVGNPDIRKLNNAGENFLTESGVYKLIFKSKKPDAEKFQDWVTDEVLPSIRKTGEYKAPKAPKVARTNLSSVNNAVKIIGGYMKQAGIDSDIQLLTIKGLYAKADVYLPIDIEADKVYYDTKYIARELGMITKAKKPAYHAVSQIISKIDISEDDIKEVWENVEGWQGVVKKYSQSVIDRVEDWLKQNEYPELIRGRSKNYHVAYMIFEETA